MTAYHSDWIGLVGRLRNSSVCRKTANCFVDRLPVIGGVGSKDFPAATPSV